MLRKLTHTDEPLRLPLLSDSVTVEAQFSFAREEVNAELDKEPSDNFTDEILRLVRATVGDSQALDVMSGLKLAAESMIAKNVRPKQMQKAVDKLRATMMTHDSREALAYVRSHLSIQRYRETSDVNDLLVQEPEGAAFITVRALTSDERRVAERKAGQKPKHGALLASRSYDIMRRETREGGDGDATYVEFIAALSPKEQMQLDDFESWSERVDREIAKVGIISIDGFDIGRNGGVYDVDQFLAECVEGDDVITEASRHIRNVGTLGKAANLPQSSQSGTDEREAGAVVSETAGSVPSASTVEDQPQSTES